MALILILATPLLWSLPIALMSAELGSAIPEEGGYYVWVRRAMGPFWAFLCAWWTWVYSWVDVAIYPVLFTEYLGTTLKLFGFLPAWEDRPVLKWAVGLCVIVPLTWLNIRGTKWVGRAALGIGLAILAPFLVFVALGLPKAHIPELGARPIAQSFQAGLFVVLWNYLGWDSMSTVAEETEEPAKSFPKALLSASMLVSAVYAFPVLVGVSFVPNLEAWTDGAWPALLGAMSAPLGKFAAFSAIIAEAGLFLTTLLAASRIPFVLAYDNLLPKRLGLIHPRFGTPYVSVIVSALIYSILSFQSFKDLVKLDVLIYTSALVLELIAFAILRSREPGMERPFKVRGGWAGVAWVVITPTVIVTIAAIHSAMEEKEPYKQLAILLVALGSGPAAFFVGARLQPKNS